MLRMFVWTAYSELSIERNVVINNQCTGLVPVASASLYQEDREILHGLIMVVIIGRLE